MRIFSIFYSYLPVMLLRRQCSMRISSPLYIVANMAFAALLWLFLPVSAQAQEVSQSDTISMVVYFPVSKSDRVYLEYAANAERLEMLKDKVLQAREEGWWVTSLSLRGSASPEGPVEFNRQLSINRAKVVSDYLIQYLELNPADVSSSFVGEDWEMFLEHLQQDIEAPWREQVLEMMEDGDRKTRLQSLEGGKVWRELLEDEFVRLRATRCDLIMSYREPPKPLVDTVTVKQIDTVMVQRTDTVLIHRVDTVYVGVPVAGPPAEEVKKPYYAEGKKMIFAVRTNFLAIPFTNVGVEVPLGEHFSIGADWYSPWIWRDHQDWGFNKEVPDKDKDNWGWCFEFQAADAEVRYWFTNTRKKPEQRLLGHSIGLYAAAGHYDFEWDWTGHQGEFGNIGLDYLYAWPIFKGRMHMEVELGLGFIYARNIAYECVLHDDVCYRIPGPRRIVTWIGPTRAQLSLVLPIYVKTKAKHN